jgi:hypothetical protein
MPDPEPSQLWPLAIAACPAGAIWVLVGAVAGYREIVVGGVLVAAAGVAGCVGLAWCRRG